ncbi:MAG: TetR/AcrR family transcriptional regulator [Solirubrobacterales bacterium]|nr:TetR/AcrR family transcriptional regulator [Solirubrobacterales bacterium]
MAKPGGETNERAKRLPPAERRRHLVAVGLDVFAERGYAGTELSDIAAAAGVGRPLIYHYFEGGKEDLYVAVLEHAWGEVIERLEVDPERGRGMLPTNLGAYLDLVEVGDPAITVIRASRRLEGPQIEAATRKSGMLLARGIAINQLGLEDPPVRVLVGLLGFLSFFEALLQGWTEGMITRADLERIVAATLPAIADATSD